MSHKPTSLPLKIFSIFIILLLHCSINALAQKRLEKSIANALTLVQKENGSNYPGYFTKYPMQEWINGIVYPAKVMRSLANNLK